VGQVVSGRLLGAASLLSTPTRHAILVASPEFRNNKSLDCSSPIFTSGRKDLIVKSAKQLSVVRGQLSVAGISESLLVLI